MPYAQTISFISRKMRHPTNRSLQRTKWKQVTCCGPRWVLRFQRLIDQTIIARFVLFCFVLFCFVLFCFVLFCFVLFCFVLFFVLFCFVLLLILFYFILFYFTFGHLSFCSYENMHKLIMNKRREHTLRHHTNAIKYE